MLNQHQVSLYFLPVESEHTCIILNDVSHRKSLEEELKAAIEAANKANSIKSKFLADMSHEIRTPLNHIIGFTELIVDKKLGDINEVQHEYLCDVLSSGHLLLSIVNEI
jgi:signal transduction histidine kinase